MGAVTRTRPREDAESLTAMEWLLDSDPAIRWQALRDLVGEPTDVVTAERARIAIEGWQSCRPSGSRRRWDGGTYRPGWSMSQLLRRGLRPLLQLLRDFGLTRTALMHAGFVLVRENVRWDVNGALLRARRSHASTESHLRSVPTASVDGIVGRPVEEQMDDGG
jgi:hypothetical protein